MRMFFIFLVLISAGISGNKVGTTIKLWKRGSLAALTSALISIPASQVCGAPLQDDMLQDPIVKAEADSLKDGSNTRAKLVTEMNGFLSNPILEKIRLPSQASVDVTADSKYVNINLFLVPIYELNQNLDICMRCVEMAQKSESMESTLKFIRSAKASLEDYSTPKLKQLFNRYSDNIFYSDKREANLYLNGGATPGSIQTTAYLYRNSIITSIDYVMNDLKQGLNDAHLLDGSGRDQFFEDVLDDLKEAKDAFDDYLALVNPADKASASAAVEVVE